MIRLATNIFFCFLLTINSQQISKISIKGNGVFPDKLYSSLLSPFNGKLFTTAISDSVKNELEKFLLEEGYYNSGIETSYKTSRSDTSKVEINLLVNEGNPTLINKIGYTEVSNEDSLYLNVLINGITSSSFSKSNIEYLAAKTLEHFENTGFPFAEIKVTAVNFYNSDNPTVDLDLNIDKNLKTELKRILIEGNSETKDYVIRRELNIKEGDTYDQRRLDEIPSTLNKTGFFKPLKEPQFFLDEKNEGILKIVVEEKNTNNFDGIIGYVPGNGNEKGFFTGFVNVFMRNLFGTGRSAMIKWEQQNRNSQELELKYKEPWIFSYPLTLQVGLFQRKQDTTYVQRNINASMEYLASRTISGLFLIESESTIPSETARTRGLIFNSSLFTTGLTLKIDTRDDIFSPRSGLIFLNSYKYTSKKIDFAENETSAISRNNNLQKFELDLSLFFSLWANQVLSLGLHGREMRGSLIELSDLYFLGGTQNLRGYKEKQFSGNRIFWSNTEYRFIFDQRSYLFTFFDTGYFYRREEPVLQIPLQESFQTGYGFGINLETAIGMLNVSYALGKGDSFSNGKIHFGIANEF